MKYFNFPITLLNDFLKDEYSHTNVLNDIMNYAMYDISREYNGDDDEKLKYATNFFGITNNDTKAFIKGRKLYDSNIGSAKVGISKDMLFDFYDNKTKTEFDKICLLAFLGLKSILGTSAYCKTNFNLMFARVEGRNKSCTGFGIFCETILKYNTRRLREKIINELQDNWYLKYYSYHTRGFYISFDMTREELIIMAEKKKASTKKELRKLEEKRIREQIFTEEEKSTSTVHHRYN